MSIREEPSQRRTRLREQAHGNRHKSHPPPKKERQGLNKPPAGRSTHRSAFERMQRPTGSDLEALVEMEAVETSLLRLCAFSSDASSDEPVLLR